MFVQHVNHAPMARRIASRAEVAWGGGSSVGAAIAVLEKAWRARRQGRRHRPDDVRAARHACGKIRRHRQSQPPLYAAAPGQIGGGNRLDADRRCADRSRHDGAARQFAAGPERTRTRRHCRARLHRPRWHQCYPFFWRHADGRAESSACRRNSSPTAMSRAAISCSPRSAPRSGSIRGKCCEVSRSAMNRQNSTATCTRSPMRRSMQWPPCSRTAR